MRHLFLINPTAGKNTDPDRISAEIHSLMAERGEPYHIRLTEYPHHAEEIARSAAEESVEPLRIYSFGGDGTLNEVVNGAAGYDHVSVTVCPVGSGNDFLKIFTAGREKFSDIGELVGGDEAVFDLVQCNDRLALNIASVGLDARVGVGMVDFKHLPLVSGKFAYVLSLVSNVIKGISNRYEVELDGERVDGVYTLMAACNGRCYGGGFCPVPTAMPDDGKLTFVLVKGVSRFKAASLVKLYGDGRGDQAPDTITIRDGRQLTVRCVKPEIAQLDGEKLVSDLMVIRMSEKKLRFAYPKGASWALETAQTAETV